MKQDCQLIVFAKAPVPGLAKTRLAPALGEHGAARLAARMLTETLRQAVDARIGAVELCCTPDAAHPAFVEAAAAFGVTLGLQGDGNLGQRMQRALARGLEEHRKAILIGTDAPGLGAQQLRDAARLLDARPVVFGPVIDGGYVLVGLSQPMPSLFEEMEWSTDQVMARTRERLRRSRQPHAELPVLADVDEPADLGHVPREWLE